MDNRTEDPELDRRKGIDRAQRALECAREDTDTAAIAATVLAYFGENIDTMAALADRAMALNPSSARVGISAVCSGCGQGSPTSY